MAVTVTLDDDAALVLFELVASGSIDDKVGAPERNALTELEGVLEKQLAQILDPNYKQLLAAARSSLVTRYGG